MNKTQALALLELIADLYQIANEPPVSEPMATNGQKKAEEPADATR
jgi:hypothetical protein